MGIRLKQYKFASPLIGRFDHKAIRVTEKNWEEVVEYICKNGGMAIPHTARNRSKRLPSRFKLKQRNFGRTWGKRDWRVVREGDYIVRFDYPPGTFGDIQTKVMVDFERAAGKAFHSISVLK